MSKQRAALYVRVSSQEQKLHGLSVDSQILALREYCEKHDLEVVNIYNDAGLSASKKLHRRSALNSLCADIEQGLIDIVLFTKLDRWFRNVPDYYAIQQVLDQNHVVWRAIWEDYETETSSGVFKVNIMLSIAQAEAQRTSERIKAINDYKRETGKFVGGRVPWGYKNVGSDVVKDADEQANVEGFFKLYLETFSISALIDYTKSLGRQHNRRQIKRYLTYDYYYGEHNGYKIDPYISIDEHNLIIKSIDGRRSRNCEGTTGRVYIFAGLIKCAKCGKIMGGHTEVKHYGGKLHERKGYLCRRNLSKLCDNTSNPRESKIESYLLEHIDEDIRKHNDMMIQEQETVNTDKQIKALKQRIKRVGDRYEEDEISRDQYIAKKEDLLRQIKALEYAKPAKVKPLPKDWKDIYSTLDLTHKREFWASFISEIVYTDKNTPPIIHYLD